jgi:hypothetical protein
MLVSCKGLVLFQQTSAHCSALDDATTRMPLIEFPVRRPEYLVSLITDLDALKSSESIMTNGANRELSELPIRSVIIENKD